MSATKAPRELWVGYPRVSHMGRRRETADDFHSVRDQVKAMRERARQLDVDLEIVDPDLNAKGKDAERATLLRIMEGVENGHYAGVLVAYLSRLSRRTRFTLELWDRVRAAGARLIAVRENLDSANMTPENWFLLRMLAAKDELEVDIATARFDEQRAGAVAAGIWAFRQTPLGYDRDPQTRRLTPNDRADDVRWAFRAAPSTPISEMARRLRMTPAGVRALLRNCVYLGELHVGGRRQRDGTISPRYENRSAHPPLVTDEEWHAAQVAQPVRPPRSRQSYPAMLAGLVVCAGCGHVMSRVSQTRAIVYKCAGRSSAGPCPAPAAITMHLLDGHVERIALRELAQLRASAVHADRELDEARMSLREAEDELTAYLQAVSAADIGAEAFGDGARIRRQGVDNARARVAVALTRSPAQINGDPVRRWPDLDSAQRTRLLRGLFEAVVVARAGGRGRIVPIETRVRVLKYGAGVVDRYAGGGSAHGIRPISLDDLDRPVVLGM